MDKGLSPIIAAVILLSFTMVLAGITMQWAGSLTDISTDKNTEKQDKLLNCSSISIDFVEVDQDYSNNDLNVSLKSIGGPAGNVSVRAHPSFENKFTDLSSDGDLKTVSLNVSSQQDKVVASSQSCPVEESKDLN